MGIARNTVRKYVRDGLGGERKPRKKRVAPARERIRERVGELLEEWTTRTTDKQRVTATRLHDVLVREGVDVGETTVREVLREWKRQRAESFVPLTYRPGEVAQVDFFEVVVDIDGKRRKAWLFVMRLMYSGRDFAWVYDRADQVSFLDAHVRAFAHFGGVPQRIVYDNLKAAVTKVLRPGRELAPRFAALAAHYCFEANFARPGEGHDKGGVESRGKNIRLQHLTPIPVGRSLETVSRELLARLDEQARTKVCRTRGPVAELFVLERAYFIALPGLPFDPRRVETHTVSRMSRVRIEGSQYSVWTHWKQLTVTTLVGPCKVELRCRGEVLVHDRAPRGESHIKYRHYLPELARKPQAARQVMPDLLAELGPPFDKLWRLLVDERGPLDAARAFARVLGAIVERDEATVRAAVERALDNDRLDLLDLPAKQHVAETVAVPEALAGYVVESGCAADYDDLLGGAA